MILENDGESEASHHIMKLLESKFSSWCHGQGCAIPKPGGEATPNGHRVINLLDPLGRAFHKAVLNASSDRPGIHQYGYARERSRRDAILQVTVTLERLQKQGLCTCANLYDLTKAFDMLSSDSVLADLRQDDTLHPTCQQLLVDMQNRLSISLPIQGGSRLCVELGAGVLQRGGTGPRLFLQVYDAAIGHWLRPPAPTSATQVQYEGQSLDLSTAAYADDPARIEALQLLIKLNKRLSNTQNTVDTNFEAAQASTQPRERVNHCSQFGVEEPTKPQRESSLRAGEGPLFDIQ